LEKRRIKRDCFTGRNQVLKREQKGWGRGVCCVMCGFVPLVNVDVFLYDVDDHPLPLGEDFEVLQM